jgi:hypothetical protein
MCSCRCAARLCSPCPMLNPRAPTGPNPTLHFTPSDSTRARVGGGRQRAKFQRQQFFWLGASRAPGGCGDVEALPLERGRAGREARAAARASHPEWQEANRRQLLRKQKATYPTICHYLEPLQPCRQEQISLRHEVTLQGAWACLSVSRRVARRVRLCLRWAVGGLCWPRRPSICAPPAARVHMFTQVQQLQERASLCGVLSGGHRPCAWRIRVHVSAADIL